MAREMPVLPEVGSRIVWPGASAPFASPSSISARATRSCLRVAIDELIDELGWPRGQTPIRLPRAPEEGCDAMASAERRYDYDWLVIGSGFGGSVSALRLSEKGYSVGVLECGRRFADN